MPKLGIPSKDLGAKQCHLLVRVGHRYCCLGQSPMREIHSSMAYGEPFHDGFIASQADLLALRGVTVANRGKYGDLLDFQILLRTMAERGSSPPKLEEGML